MARSTIELGTKLFDKFTVTKVIQSKGMSNVYACMDDSLNKLVCLKEIIKEDAGRDNVEYDSLINESRILSQLSFLGVPHIISIEEDNQSVYVFMDWVSGESLSDYISREGAMPEDLAVSKLTQLALILIYLHSRPLPIFYRDLKPANIMLQDDQVILLDYGISVEISENNRVIEQPLGTRGFAAPEQAIKGQPYDLRSDIYSFGVIAFYILTGLDPNKVKSFDLKSFDGRFSTGLSRIVLKCTQQDPALRFQSMTEVLVALDNYKKIDSHFYEKARKKIRTSYGMTAAGLVLVLLSGGLYMGNAYADNNRFSNQLETARHSAKVADYAAALSIKPTDLSVYEEMLQAIEKTGQFTVEDEQELFGVLAPNMTAIKSSSDYPRLAYKLGRLYWFFYTPKDDPYRGMSLSTEWFDDAIKGKFEPERSQVLYNIGLFQRDIASAIVTSDDSGMYREYWNNLVSIQDSEQGEVINLQIRRAILDAVTSYTYQLRVDGVSQAEVQGEVAKIRKYLRTIKPSPGRPEELFADISMKLDRIDDRIVAAYRDLGEPPATSDKES